MTIPPALRELVRQRADFACEFCGVTEDDVGGELTIDHFRPRAKGGSDHLDNLVYCCSSCNQYKSDYWPAISEDPKLWNPRLESAAKHVLELDDGVLHPLTPAGTFTVERLRLNRSPLIAHRLRRRRAAERARVLDRFEEMNPILAAVLFQEAGLMEEQRRLLGSLAGTLRRLLDIE